MPQTQKVTGVATNIRREKDGTLIVRYHSTDVVTVKADGSIVLDTGGWKTATTRTRMNQASNQFNLGYQVYQKDFKWYVRVDASRGNSVNVDFSENEITLPSRLDCVK